MVGEGVAGGRLQRWRDRNLHLSLLPNRFPFLRPIGDSNESESAVRHVAGATCPIVAAFESTSLQGRPPSYLGAPYTVG